MIIQVEPIPEEWVIRAKLMAEEMGKLKKSIRAGKGNVIGFLGEIMVAEALGATQANTYDYDIKVGDLRIDVKTKATTVVPEPGFMVTVADFNTRQNCDYYYFTRVHESTGWGWLLGGISSDDFYKKATFYTEGEVDPTSEKGWKFRADCYNLPISELKQPKSIWDRIPRPE